MRHGSPRRWSWTATARRTGCSDVARSATKKRRAGRWPTRAEGGIRLGRAWCDQHRVSAFLRLGSLAAAGGGGRGGVWLWGGRRGGGGWRWVGGWRWAGGDGVCGDEWRGGQRGVERCARMSRGRQRRRGARGDGRRGLRVEFGLPARGATSIASRPSCASTRWQQQGPEEGGSEFPGGEQEGRAVTGGGLWAGRA